MSTYKAHPFYKLATIPVLPFIVSGVYSSFIEKDFLDILLSILGVFFLLYFAIAFWKLKIILDNKGIRVYT